MKIMDKNGRLFGKISIIDVVVILVVIALALALAFKRNQTHTGTVVTNIPITFQLHLIGERTHTANAIRVGDNIYDLDNRSNGPLGKITDIEVMPEPGLRQASFPDGTDEMVPAEDCVNMVLTIQGEGIISDNRYLLNRVYNLGINANRNYYTTYAQFYATVISITE